MDYEDFQTMQEIHVYEVRLIEKLISITKDVCNLFLFDVPECFLSYTLSLIH